MPTSASHRGTRMRGCCLEHAAHAVVQPNVFDVRWRCRNRFACSGIDQLVFDNMIQNAQSQRFCRADPPPAQHHAQGLLCPDQSRQSLGCARMGQYSQPDLGQSHRGARQGDPEMRRQSQLQSATQGIALNRGNNRLREIFDPQTKARQIPLPLRAHTGTLHTRRKMRARAGQHHRMNVSRHNRKVQPRGLHLRLLHQVLQAGDR